MRFQINVRSSDLLKFDRFFPLQGAFLDTGIEDDRAH